MKNILLILVYTTLLPIISFTQFKDIGGKGKAIISNLKAKGDTIHVTSMAGLHVSHDGGLTWSNVPGTTKLSKIGDFQVVGDLIVVVNLDEDENSKTLTIHTTTNGGQHWVKKEIITSYGFSGFDNELHITAYNGIITVTTYEEIYVSKDFGTTFRKIANKNLLYFISDYIYYQDSFHFLIEIDKVSKTKDFVSFIDVFIPASGRIEGYFSANNTLYIYDGESHILKNNVFETINDLNLDPSIFEIFNVYNFHNGLLYVYQDYYSEVKVYDSVFNLVKVYKFFDLLPEENADNKLYIFDEYMYYFNKNKYGCFKKPLSADNSKRKEIAGNIKGAKGEYKMVDNRLWQVKDRLSYYNDEINRWQDAQIKYGTNQYAIVDKNSIFITEPASIVNLGGIKIRNSNLPEDFNAFINCNDIVMVRNHGKTKIYTMIGGILPWIEINGGINWNEIKPEYANGYYIMHNERDEILYTTNKYNWQKIKLNPAIIGNKKISSVQFGTQGDIFITAGEAMYKSNTTNTIWTKVNASPHPYPNEMITDFAMIKNVMIQTIYGQGVIISLDFGNSWQKFEEGLPDVFNLDILVNEKYIYITNFGSVFQRSINEIPGLSSSENDLTINDTNISISPNPSAEMINFELKESLKIIDIKIFSISGKLISHHQNLTENNVNLDIKLLNNGVYFVSVNTNNGTFNGKFIKI